MSAVCVCLSVVTGWLVGGWCLLLCENICPNDKWVCLCIVNAVPKHWRDVVSDAWQSHAAHLSDKCPTPFFNGDCIFLYGWCSLFQYDHHCVILKLHASFKVSKLRYDSYILWAGPQKLIKISWIKDFVWCMFHVNDFSMWLHVWVKSHFCMLHFGSSQGHVGGILVFRPRFQPF